MGDNWKRLGEEIIRRRVELGHATRDSFARESRLSSRLLSDLENGRRQSYDPSTLARLERALRWVYGSAQAILNGGDPTPMPADEQPAERHGGDLDLVTLAVRAGLPQESLERIVAYIEMRRADQHLELLAEVKRLIEAERADVRAALSDGSRFEAQVKASQPADFDPAEVARPRRPEHSGQHVPKSVHRVSD